MNTITIRVPRDKGINYLHSFLMTLEIHITSILSLLQTVQTFCSSSTYIVNKHSHFLQAQTATVLTKQYCLICSVIKFTLNFLYSYDQLYR